MMKNRKLFLAVIFAALMEIPFSLSARTEGKSVRFNPNGELKIVQFTDLHYNADMPQSRIVLRRIEEVLESEKPDLIVITGDLIYSKPARKALDEIFSVVSRYGIPFCTVFGNHDPDFASRSEIYDIIRSYRGCIMPQRPSETESPDYIVPVTDTQGVKTEAILYFIDSNSHLYENGKFVGYDSIHPEQVEWYRNASSDYTKKNGGKPYPALAFFHIPLPEFHDAVTDEECAMVGTRMETACAPSMNTGMFDAIKKSGDVMGLFVGHDHDNDYSVMYRDVLLSYGRFTGGNTEYNNLSNGARIIILKEGMRSFDSYIILKGGEIKDRITYPDSFVKTSWRDRPLDPECK